MLVNILRKVWNFLMVWAESIAEARQQIAKHPHLRGY